MLVAWLADAAIGQRSVTSAATDASNVASPPTTGAPSSVIARFERILIGVALVAGILHRLVYGWFAPLWLDESYTGVIASQANFAGLWDWCRHELSGPTFYGIAWLWAKVAGNGDIALRLPSFVFSVGAVAVAAAWGGPDRRERLLWAAFTAVWLPGLMFATQARPQALLFLLATVQAVAFLRCIDDRSPRWMTAWAMAGAMMLLTHIYAAAIVGLQGLCVVWSYRNRPKALWPLLVPFAIVAAWLPMQLPFVLNFLKPGVASYAMLGSGNLRSIAYDLLGLNDIAFAILLAVAAILAVQIARYRRDGTPLPYERREALLALTGVLSIALAIGFGVLRSSYAPRYLVPFIPAMLFGLVRVLSRVRFASGVLPSALLAAWAALTLQDAAFYSGVAAQQTLNPLEFERGSDWLMAHHSPRIVFMWDNPTSALNRADLQSQVAGFFFRRAGYSTDVRAVYLPHSGQDGIQLARLADDLNAAILWIGATPYPAGLYRMAHFQCRDFGEHGSRSMACARR